MIQSSIKIRPVRITDNNRINKFFDEVDMPVVPSFVASANPRKLTSPVLKIHYYLPLGWKILQEGYVAVENDNIIGLIAIIPDSKTKLRWKIDQFYLKPNAYDVGKLLIDYIVNKYGAEGVETFIAELDEMNADAQDLFKNACGFRFCTREYTYKYPLNGEILPEVDINNFRKMNSSDTEKLYDLYIECLKPQAKISLEKDPDDFNSGISRFFRNHFNGIEIAQWVLENPENKSIVAYADIRTVDNTVSHACIFTALPYSEYYKDILNYLINYAGLKNRNAILHINLCEAIQSYSHFQDIINKLELELIKSSIILVKDYWRPLKERKPLTTSPIIIFPEGTSTAYNPVSTLKKG
jgi:hypothetical protein